MKYSIIYTAILFFVNINLCLSKSKFYAINNDDGYVRFSNSFEIVDSTNCACKYKIPAKKVTSSIKSIEIASSYMTSKCIDDIIMSNIDLFNSVKWLEIIYNKRLVNFPNAIVKLKSLESLRIHDTGIEFIPKEIDELKKLTYLQITNSKLSTETTNYFLEHINPNLVDLVIDGNLIDFFPDRICKLSMLRYLGLSMNNEILHFPDCFFSLEKLRGMEYLSTKNSYDKTEILEKVYIEKEIVADCIRKRFLEKGKKVLVQ